MCKFVLVIIFSLCTPILLANEKPNFVSSKEAIIRELAPVRFKGVTQAPHDVRSKGFQAVKDTDPRAAMLVHFRIDSHELDPQQLHVLHELSDALKNELGRVALTIIGHTDSDGGFAHNDQLSLLRADSVRQFLIGQGITPARLLATGNGERAPRISNLTAEGRAINRRVEFVNSGQY